MYFSPVANANSLVTVQSWSNLVWATSRFLITHCFWFSAFDAGGEGGWPVVGYLFLCPAASLTSSISILDTALFEPLDLTFST